MVRSNGNLFFVLVNSIYVSSMTKEKRNIPFRSKDIKDTVIFQTVNAYCLNWNTY